MWWELWDRRSRNRLGGYRTEAEALAVVERIYADQGLAGLAGLALGPEQEDEDDPGAVLFGEQLLARLRETTGAVRHL